MRSFKRENRSGVYVFFQSVFKEYSSLILQLIFILRPWLWGFFLSTQLKHSLVVLVVYHLIVRNKCRNLFELHSEAAILLELLAGSDVQETLPTGTFPTTALKVVFISITIESFYLHERMGIIKVFLGFFFDLKDVVNIHRKPVVEIVGPSRYC